MIFSSSQNKKINAWNVLKQKNVQNIVKFLQGYPIKRFHNIFIKYRKVFFLQNHPFQTFLVPKRYIFIYVNIKNNIKSLCPLPTR